MHEALGFVGASLQVSPRAGMDPSGVATGRDGPFRCRHGQGMDLKEVSLKTRYSQIWSVRVDQNFYRV